MKCEGGITPPCARCRKAGRECHPQFLPGKGVSKTMPPRTTDSNATVAQQPQQSVYASSPIGYPQNRDENYPRVPVVSLFGSQQNPRAEHTRASQFGGSAAQGVVTGTISFSGVASRSSVLTSSALPSIYSNPPMDFVSNFHKQSSADSWRQKNYTSTESDGENRDLLSSRSASLAQNGTQMLLLPLNDLRDMINMYVH